MILIWVLKYMPNDILRDWLKTGTLGERWHTKETNEFQLQNFLKAYHSYWKLFLPCTQKKWQKCDWITYIALVNRNLSGFIRPSCSTIEQTKIHPSLTVAPSTSYVATNFLGYPLHLIPSSSITIHQIDPIIIKLVTAAHYIIDRGIAR